MCSPLKMVGYTSELQLGSLFALHFPNASKTYLVVKDKTIILCCSCYRHAFFNTGIVFSTDGQRYLGAVIGRRDYTATYVTSKIQTWYNEVKHLAEIVSMFPHANYAAFIVIYSLLGCWSYFICILSQIYCSL